MAGFDFEESGGFEWVDTPGSEWDKADLPVDLPINITWLTRPQAINHSNRYQADNMTTKNQAINISDTFTVANISTAKGCFNQSTTNRAGNISKRHVAQIIIGGKTMSNQPASIRVNHGEVIDLQLQAVDVQTGATVPLTEQQMTDITRVIINLGSGNKLDTNSTNITLGAGKEVDHEVDKASAKLSLRLGGIAELANMVGSHTTPHIDIYFTGNSLPIPFDCMPIMILADD